MDTVSNVWKWTSDGIEHICKEWLELLVDMIKLEEIGAPILLREIFHSEAEVVKKYRQFVVDKVCYKYKQ